MLHKIKNIIKQSCWKYFKKSKHKTKSAKNMNKKIMKETC